MNLHNEAGPVPLCDTERLIMKFLVFNFKRKCFSLFDHQIILMDHHLPKIEKEVPVQRGLICMKYTFRLFSHHCRIYISMLTFYTCIWWRDQYGQQCETFRFIGGRTSISQAV